MQGLPLILTAEFRDGIGFLNPGNIPIDSKVSITVYPLETTDYILSVISNANVEITQTIHITSIPTTAPLIQSVVYSPQYLGDPDLIYVTVTATFINGTGKVKGIMNEMWGLNTIESGVPYQIPVSQLFVTRGAFTIEVTSDDGLLKATKSYQLQLINEWGHTPIIDSYMASASTINAGETIHVLSTVRFSDQTYIAPDYNAVITDPTTFGLFTKPFVYMGTISGQNYTPQTINFPGVNLDTGIIIEPMIMNIPSDPNYIMFKLSDDNGVTWKASGISRNPSCRFKIDPDGSYVIKAIVNNANVITSYIASYPLNLNSVYNIATVEPTSDITVRPLVSMSYDLQAQNLDTGYTVTGSIAIIVNQPVAKFNRPTALIYDNANSRLIIADNLNNRIRIHSLISGVTSTLQSSTEGFYDSHGALFSKPLALALDKNNGYIFVLDTLATSAHDDLGARRILKIETDGTITIVADLGDNLMAKYMAIAPNGDLYITATTRTLTTFNTPYPNGDYRGLTLNNYEDYLIKVTQAGVVTTVIGGLRKIYFDDISGIAIDSDGAIYIGSVTYISKVVIGETVTVSLLEGYKPTDPADTGNYSGDMEGARMKFAYVAGMFYNDNSIYLIDNNNGKIKECDIRSTTPRFTWGSIIQYFSEWRTIVSMNSHAGMDFDTSSDPARSGNIYLSCNGCIYAIPKNRPPYILAGEPFAADYVDA